MKAERSYWRNAATRTILIGLLVLGACQSCSESSWDNSSVQSHELDRGLNGEPESLSPSDFHSNQASTILREIGEGLVKYLPSGGIDGAVASTWSVSDDGLTYRFAIRSDARWSSGDPLVAEDFVEAFRALVDPSNGHRHAAILSPVLNAERVVEGSSPVKELGVTAVDSQTLEIRLERHTSHFLQLLTHPSTFPLRAGASFVENSNGAYILADRLIGSEILLKKNENYWNAHNVAYDNVRYHIVEETVEFNRFRAGELDITGNVPSGVFEIAKREYSNQLKVSPYLGIYFYGFNLNSALFSDNLKLRKALNLAVDRESLVLDVLGRGELPAVTWVPPGISGYESPRITWSSVQQHEREEMARDLLKELGYSATNRLSFSLIYNASDVQQRIAVALQSMWQRVLDAQVELNSMEFGVLMSKIQIDPAVEMFRLSWTGDYIDPESFLQIFEADNASNFTRFQDPRYDLLLRRSRSERNTSKRFEMLAEAEQILLEELPIVPLYFYVSKHLVSSEVIGWQDNVLDIHESQYLRPDTSPNLPR